MRTAPLRVATASIILLTTAMAATGASPDPVFTYQGVLTDGGGPANGIYDLRFTLFDAAAGGSDLALVVLEDHAVVGGRLMAELDFGDPFDGRALWLEIEVRPGTSPGAFTTLNPRQPLTAAPSARFAADADHAVTADSAATAGETAAINGQEAGFYRAWENRTEVPAGLDDGDDDVIGDLICAPGELAKWDGSAWVCAEDVGAAFTRTVVVPGTVNSAANGAALQAALAAIPEPTSQEEAWRIRLEPGVYDLGVDTIGLLRWMLLEGAGQATTRITSAYCSESAVSWGVVNGDEDAEIRDLTVESTCASPTGRVAAVKFNWEHSRGRLTRVTVLAGGHGADRCGGVSMLGDEAVLERVTAWVDGCPTRNTGIQSEGVGTLILDCVASATGGGIHHGLLVGGSARVSRGSFSSDDDPSAGDSAIQISGNVEVLDVTASSDGVAVNIDAWDDIVVTMSRMEIDGKVDAYVGSGHSLALLIDHSRIEAAGTTLEGEAGATIGIAGTQLSGDPVLPDGATVHCAGVWDESWGFFPNTCP